MALVNETMAKWLSENNISHTSIVNVAASPQQFNDYEVDNLTLIYGPKRDPLYVVLPITFIYMVIFVTGVIGNISTCIVIAKNRSMHTATNYYLFSLAVSDFMLLIAGVPQEVYSIWSKYPYVFGEGFCVMRGIMAETSANATVLTITSFTVERYLAICHPFLQHTMSKLSRAIRLIFVVWIFSIFLAIPQALQFGIFTDDNGIDHCILKRIIIKHSFELSTVLFFITPMTLITVLYILIGLKLRTPGLVKHTNGAGSRASGAVSMQRQVNSCRQQTNVGTRRVLKMLVAVVVAFFLCWAPFHLQRLVAFYNNDNVLIYAIMTYISGVLYYLSTCINPLLYNIMSNKFREAFKETLAKCCYIQKRSYASDSSYRVLSRRQRRWNTNQESADYSGSSIRDESMYTTVSQKQSFDSMTVSQYHSVKPPGPSHNAMKLQSNVMYSGHPTMVSHAHNDDAHTNKIVPMIKCQSTETDRYHPPEFLHDKINEIRISISCTNKIKMQNTSRTSQMLGGLFGWRQNTRNIGYYSPPMEHPIDKISIRLDKCATDANDVAGHSLATKSDWSKGKGHVAFATKANDNIEYNGGVDSDGADSISNSSLKDCNAVALEDELSTYMKELRLRELR